MVDLHKVLRDFLLAKAELVELVGERVWAGRNVPPIGYKPVGDGPCVVFRVRGGGVAYDDGLLLPSVQVKCYGADELAAWGVYRVLFDVLQNGAGSGVLHAEAEGLGELLEEPETEWHFALSFWRVVIRG